MRRGRLKHKMDHLACFIPAMLALGVQQGAVHGSKADTYMSLAADLTYTCWKMYSSHPSGARHAACVAHMLGCQLMRSAPVSMLGCSACQISACWRAGLSPEYCNFNVPGRDMVSGCVPASVRSDMV